MTSPTGCSPCPLRPPSGSPSPASATDDARPASTGDHATSHVPGAFQAGPIGCLADFTGASAAVSLLPPGTAAATVDLTVKLLAEARGEALIATGRAFSPARTITVAAVDIDVVTTQGRSLCATALVTIRVRRPPLAASSSLPTQT